MTIATAYDDAFAVDDYRQAVHALRQASAQQTPSADNIKALAYERGALLALSDYSEHGAAAAQALATLALAERS